MPVLNPISPIRLKRAFETAGYKLIDEDEHIWVMAWTDDDVPFPISKHGKLVPNDLLDSIVHHPKTTRALSQAIVDACTAAGSLSDRPPPDD